MALYRGILFVYTILLVFFTVMFGLYSTSCHCNDCPQQRVSLEQHQSSFRYRQSRDVDDDGQSLTNVEALNEFLHRSQLDQQSEYERNGTENAKHNLKDLPTIFIVTPTYKRWTQKADLTRLCQTLMHVEKLEWIVVEDRVRKSELVSDFLDHCKVSSVHLIEKTSENFTNVPIKTEDGKVYYGVKKPRGIEQRNKALEWIRQTYKHRNVKGLVYFADDDNTYDLRIFKEMRYTKKVSVWPVGLAGGLKFEGPKCSQHKVTGWYSYWATDRIFKIDFAGFAINLNLLMNSKYVIPVDSKPGYVEDAFIRQFVGIDDLEPKAKSCMKVCTSCSNCADTH